MLGPAMLRQRGMVIEISCGASLCKNDEQTARFQGKIYATENEALSAPAGKRLGSKHGACTLAFNRRT